MTGRMCTYRYGSNTRETRGGVLVVVGVVVVVINWERLLSARI